MKIVYIVTNLNNRGGTERILTDKANYLSSVFGYDVSIITCTQRPDELNAYYLSKQIKQINLDIRYYTVYKYKYPKRLWMKIKMARLLRKELTETVCQIAPDIIIGVGHYKADLICTLHCKSTKIIECHDGRMITSILYQKQERSHISRLYMLFYQWAYFRKIEHHADIIVTQTVGAKEKWRKAKSVVIIPNFSLMPITHYSPCNSKRIIAVGRLGWEKGYDRLIDIWEIVSKKHTDWQLDIFGDGDGDGIKDKLLNKINKNNISNILIHPSTDNISEEYTNSSILVLTSYFEAFSLVILEAMMHGVPCVAFDCPYGPKSLIANGNCGFLIENGNVNSFVDKLCCLIENENLRLQFSAAAIKQAMNFDAEIIMNKWKLLFEKVSNK